MCREEPASLNVMIDAPTGLEQLVEPRARNSERPAHAFRRKFCGIQIALNISARPEARLPQNGQRVEARGYAITPEHRIEANRQ